jgi:hypothetical protein
MSLIFRPADSEPVEPHLWGRAHDGRLWAVMCRDCDTLGGHNPTCRRARPRPEATMTDAAMTDPATMTASPPAPVAAVFIPDALPGGIPPGLVPDVVTLPAHIAAVIVGASLRYTAAVFDSWARVLRTTGQIADGGR